MANMTNDRTERGANAMFAGSSAVIFAGFYSYYFYRE
jgi:hypothetical protein